MGISASAARDEWIPASAARDEGIPTSAARYEGIPAPVNISPKMPEIEAASTWGAECILVYCRHLELFKTKYLLLEINCKIPDFMDIFWGLQNVNSLYTSSSYPHQANPPHHGIG